MGYTTEFAGSITIHPPLSEEEAAFLREFARKDHRTENLPGNYCQWEPTHDGTALGWDGGEKFYHSVEWMEYLIKMFLRSNHVLNGVIDAQGEDMDDRWRLVVKNNVVTKQEATLFWSVDEEEDDW